jgi:hypothetical protein
LRRASSTIARAQPGRRLSAWPATISLAGDYQPGLTGDYQPGGAQPGRRRSTATGRRASKGGGLHHAYEQAAKRKSSNINVSKCRWCFRTSYVAVLQNLQSIHCHHALHCCCECSIITYHERSIV